MMKTLQLDFCFIMTENPDEIVLENVKMFHLESMTKALEAL
jgi:hypothetical protein